MSKQHIKKGDTVQVLAGEDRGKQGRVLQVLVKKDRVVVEGVNVVTKATKQGGLVKKEAGIHVSNVALLDPKSGKPVRVGFRKNDAGKTVRYSKKSGEEIK